MTRDFDKPRRERNDMRPYNRRQPSSKPGEEHYSRPGRPRLNRETVDRAWENGAPTNHPDYHPRNSGNNPRSGRPYGQKPRSSSSDGRYTHRREGDYQRESARYERYPNQNNSSNSRTPGNRTRPFNPRERHVDDQPSGERREYGSGSRSGYRNNSSGRYNGDNRGSYNERPPRGRNDGRKEQGYSYRDRDTRQGNRDARPPRYNTREQRPYRSEQHHEPEETRRPYRRNYRPDGYEQFEGDYEQFGAREHRPAPRRYESAAPEEKSITRLPDGRVLKGPRSVQRKNARFWTAIDENTDELVQHIHPEQETVEQPEETKQTKRPTAGELEVEPEQPKTKAVRRTQKSSAGTTPREKKAGTRKRADGSASSDVPRPSRRGFKWPTS